MAKKKKAKKTMLDMSDEIQDKVVEPIDPPPKKQAAPSPIMQKVMAGHEKKFGKNKVYTGSSLDDYTTVLPYTPLLFQYMLGVSGLPIRQFLFLAGAAKSYKTSLVLEFMRWMFESAKQVDGTAEALIVNTEHKWSDTKAYAVLREWTSNYYMFDADHLEDWQKSVNDALSTWAEAVEKQKKDEPVPLLGLGVDSIIGSQTEELQKKVRDTGSMGRGYYDRAQRIWQWVQTQASLLRSIPVLMVFTNHQTDDVDAFSPNPNIKPKKVSGGSASGFHCSVDIRIKRSGKISSGGREGWKLTMGCEHNSLGPMNRRITVPYIEGYGPHPDDPEDFIQMDQFCWHEGLVAQLYEWCKAARVRGTEKDTPELVKEIMGDMTEATKKGAGKVYSCPRLNVSSSDELSGEELGKMIEEDAQVYKELQSAMRISKKSIWKSGMTF